MSSLTVQAFAAKIHAFMPFGIEVDCFGRNVDRLLFNPPGGKAHHSFILGRVEGTRGDDITGVTIFAGAAHGIRKGTTFNVYQNHIETDQKPIGHLEVTDKYKAVINTTTTKLSLTLDTTLPVVFFVVETGSPDKTLNIFTGDVNTQTVKNSSWDEVDAAKAKVVLKRGGGGQVEILWNAFPKELLPSSVTGLCHNLSVLDNGPDLIKAINITPHGSHNALFKEVDDDQKPSGKNLLVNGIVNLEIPEYNPSQSYCLVLNNKTEHEIWPFVFICNPSDFSIRLWYTATKPLAPKTAGSESVLEIGCGNEADLKFEWNPDQGLDIAYLKILVTKVQTSFSSLTQYDSTGGEKLREFSQPVGASPKNSESQHKDPESSTPTRIDWDTLQIMIARTYSQRVSSSSSFGPRSKKWGMRPFAREMFRAR